MKRSGLFFGVLLWLAAAGSAFVIQGVLESPSEALAGGSTDPLSRFVGAAKEAFGDTLFIKADSYFHGGVIHEDHHDDSAAEVETEGALDHEAKESPKDWIARINDGIQTHELMHLAKEKRMEMLPFFSLAVSLDSHNVEAILTTAFWLEREFGKPENAAPLLKKGALDNPDSWEIENALGHFYFRQKNYALSEGHLSAALKKLGTTPIERYQHMDLYYYLAEACFAQGKKIEALKAYRNAVRFFDEKATPFLRSSIGNKIEKLAQ